MHDSWRIVSSFEGMFKSVRKMLEPIPLTKIHRFSPTLYAPEKPHPLDASARYGNDRGQLVITWWTLGNRKSRFARTISRRFTRHDIFDVWDDDRGGIRRMSPVSGCK